MVANDDYYTKLPTGNFVSGTDYSSMATKAATKTLTVKGIIRLNRVIRMEFWLVGLHTALI